MNSQNTQSEPPISPEEIEILSKKAMNASGIKEQSFLHTKTEEMPESQNTSISNLTTDSVSLNTDFDKVETSEQVYPVTNSIPAQNLDKIEEQEEFPKIEPKEELYTKEIQNETPTFSGVSESEELLGAEPTDEILEHRLPDLPQSTSTTNDRTSTISWMRSIIIGVLLSIIMMIIFFSFIVTPKPGTIFHNINSAVTSIL